MMAYSLSEYPITRDTSIKTVLIDNGRLMIDLHYKGDWMVLHEVP